MADEVAKRRELRRRKILENSEDRLRKLTSVDRTQLKDLNHGLHETSTDISESRDALSQETPTNLTCKSNCRYVNQNLPNFQTDTTDEDEDEHFEQRTQSVPNVNSGHIQALPKILTENKTCSKVKLDSNRAACKLASSLQPIDFFLQRRWFCVLLAVFGRMMGYLLEGNFLAKGVTSLFIVLEIIFFSTEIFSETDQRPQPQSLLLTALLLCGIRNAARIAQLTELLAKLAVDFSVFFFTFFMCHWWIETTF